MAKVEVKRPIISTISIEVKALKIGKKQVTLSVFDQLNQLDIGYHNWEGLVAWGYVIRKGEKYIIYDKNNKLYKSLIMPIGTKLYFSKFLEYADFTKDIESLEGINSIGGQYVYKGEFLTFLSKGKIRKFGEWKKFFKKHLPDKLKYYEREYSFWDAKSYNKFRKFCLELEQLFIAV